MIEDDLRTLLAESMPGIRCYSRMIPLELPECITVQEIGGAPSTAGIRRAVHRISVMAISTDQATAQDRLRQARNAIIRGLPADIGGTHYYLATALADGSLKKKALNGPRYIEFTDMEVIASL